MVRRRMKNSFHPEFQILDLHARAAVTEYAAEYEVEPSQIDLAGIFCS